MIINSQNLIAAARGYRALFKEQLSKVESFHELLAMIDPSKTPSSTYAWLGDLPSMREWIGERVIHGLEAHGYTLEKRDFELTIGVHRDEILFDNLGVVKPRIQDLAEQAKRQPDVLVAQLLLLGFETLCFDGQYFFDEDHPVGGESQSNVGSAVLSADAFEAAYAAMGARLNEAGQPMGILPTDLVVPPQLRATANQIIKAETIEGTTNTNRDAVKVKVWPALASNPTAWFLFDLSRSVKPVIVKKTKAPEFVAMDKVDDEHVFNQKEFRYGVDSMVNAGYGLWQLAWASTGEG
jgi:phage major head subunit gpT-like protein